jgi:hypothetical protein
VTEFFVNYAFASEQCQAGPYRSRAEAVAAMERIRRRRGVSDVWLGRHRFFYRKLVNRAA